jgi:hypothetical protein
LEYSLELLRRGTGNARDVTDAQSSLLSSQDSFSQARSDLQVQVLEFLKDSGTIRIDPSAGSIGRALDRDARLNPLQPAGVPAERPKDPQAAASAGPVASRF